MESLSKILERVAELQAEKQLADDNAKRIGKELAAVEQLAVEQLALSGMEQVRVAGKTWWLRDSHSVSVVGDQREKVVAAAKAEGLDDFITVNTATLKSWLIERRKRLGGDGPLAEGTAFAGLVSEYSEVRLSHRAVG